MKKIIFTMILGMTIVLFTSAVSKTDIIPSGNIVKTTLPVDITGTWVGSYWSGSPDGGPLVYLKLYFMPDGNLQVQSGDEYGYGTWTMSGDQVFATYTITPLTAKGTGSNTYSLSGNVNEENITGTIQSASGGSFMFQVTRQG